MKSPFPGMDPYVERFWHDVHLAMIAGSRKRIQAELRCDLLARVDGRIVIDTEHGPRYPRPDVHIVETGPVASWQLPSSEGAVVTAIELDEPGMTVTEHYVDIIDATTGGKVVTTIEFCSPATKASPQGREQYQRKLDECASAGVNIVEVDLNRSGRRELYASRWAQSSRHQATYQASVWRAARPTKVLVYPIPLPARLPSIQIPLRPQDDEIQLDLQAVFDECYVEARYDKAIRYDQPPDPPLSEPDAAWADQLLRDAGKRS